MQGRKSGAQKSKEEKAQKIKRLVMGLTEEKVAKNKNTCPTGTRTLVERLVIKIHRHHHHHHCGCYFGVPRKR